MSARSRDLCLFLLISYISAIGFTLAYINGERLERLLHRRNNAVLEHAGLGSPGTKLVLLDHENDDSIFLASYQWTIESYEDRRERRLDSSIFRAAAALWQLILYPHGDDGHAGYISLYLGATLAPHWGPNEAVQGTWRFTVVNSSSRRAHVIQEAEHNFSRYSTNWGFNKLMLRRSILDPAEGWMGDDGNLYIQIDVRQVVPYWESYAGIERLHYDSVRSSVGLLEELEEVGLHDIKVTYSIAKDGTSSIGYSLNGQWYASWDDLRAALTAQLGHLRWQFETTNGRGVSGDGAGSGFGSGSRFEYGLTALPGMAVHFDGNAGSGSRSSGGGGNDVADMECTAFGSFRGAVVAEAASASASAVGPVGAVDNGPARRDGSGGALPYDFTAGGAIVYSDGTSWGLMATLASKVSYLQLYLSDYVTIPLLVGGVSYVAVALVLQLVHWCRTFWTFARASKATEGGGAAAAGHRARHGGAQSRSGSKARHHPRAKPRRSSGGGHAGETQQQLHLQPHTTQHQRHQCRQQQHPGQQNQDTHLKASHDMASTAEASNVVGAVRRTCSGGSGGGGGSRNSSSAASSSISTGGSGGAGCTSSSSGLARYLAFSFSWSSKCSPSFGSAAGSSDAAKSSYCPTPSRSFSTGRPGDGTAPDERPPQPPLHQVSQRQQPQSRNQVQQPTSNGPRSEPQLVSTGAAASVCPPTQSSAMEVTSVAAVGLPGQGRSQGQGGDQGQAPPQPKPKADPGTLPHVVAAEASSSRRKTSSGSSGSGSGSGSGQRKTIGGSPEADPKRDVGAPGEVRPMGPFGAAPAAGLSVAAASDYPAAATGAMRGSTGAAATAAIAEAEAPPLPPHRSWPISGNGRQPVSSQGLLLQPTAPPADPLLLPPSLARGGLLRGASAGGFGGFTGGGTCAPAIPGLVAMGHPAAAADWAFGPWLPSAAATARGPGYGRPEYSAPEPFRFWPPEATPFAAPAEEPTSIGSPWRPQLTALQQQAQQTQQPCNLQSGSGLQWLHQLRFEGETGEGHGALAGRGSAPQSFRDPSEHPSASGVSAAVSLPLSVPGAAFTAASAEAYGTVYCNEYEDSGGDDDTGDPSIAALVANSVLDAAEREDEATGDRSYDHNGRRSCCTRGGGQCRSSGAASDGGSAGAVAAASNTSGSSLCGDRSCCAGEPAPVLDSPNSGAGGSCSSSGSSSNIGTSNGSSNGCWNSAVSGSGDDAPASSTPSVRQAAATAAPELGTAAREGAWRQAVEGGWALRLPLPLAAAAAAAATTAAGLERGRAGAWIRKQRCTVCRWAAATVLWLAQRLLAAAAFLEEAGEAGEAGQGWLR